MSGRSRMADEGFNTTQTNSMNNYFQVLKAWGGERGLGGERGKRRWKLEVREGKRIDRENGWREVRLGTS